MERTNVEGRLEALRHGDRRWNAVRTLLVQIVGALLGAVAMWWAMSITGIWDQIYQFVDHHWAEPLSRPWLAAAARPIYRIVLLAPIALGATLMGAYFGRHATRILWDADARA